MKKTHTLVLLSLLVVAFAYSQVHVGAKFIPKQTITNPDTAYSNDIGIRGAWVAPDLDQDGKPEIFVTDYTKTGRVHAFQAAGNDTLEWIWSSPRLDLVEGLPYGAGGASTPRTIRHGDMDGDGKGEVIFFRGGVGGGVLIFEWDGTPGSHKFGTIPSAFIPADVPYGANLGPLAGTPNEGGLQLTVEHFEVMDVDGDGKQELVAPKNLSGATNDDFLVITGVGEWEFENQGFAAFQIEGTSFRTASVKFGGVSPYAVHPMDLDGDGKMELVCHNWNFADYWIMKVTGADTYVTPDTTGTPINGEQFFYMTPATDHVALFGGIPADLDDDGNGEVYFPLYTDGAETSGSLWIVDYSPSDNVQKADSTHAVNIASAVSQNASGVGVSSFTGVAADLDRNGKTEILVGSSYPSNVVAVEYNGSGSLRDPANYTRKVFYTGEADNYGTITYKDSAGVTKDTVRTGGEGFVSKMTWPHDIDGDGKLEVILPYQALVDSVTYTWQTWKDTVYSTDSSIKVSNPKKWGFRSLEADVAGSVGNKDMVVITPDDYLLFQNYPNTINHSNTNSLALKLNKKVTAMNYEILGKEVPTLINGEDFAKGTHNVVWNGRDNNGRQVASGTYIFKMSSGNMEKSMKMMLMK